MKCFCEIWNVRYSCIHCCANLVAGLASYHVSSVNALFVIFTSGFADGFPVYGHLWWYSPQSFMFA